MRNKIKDILENNYHPTGLDMQKATNELLNLFGVSNNAVAFCGDLSFKCKFRKGYNCYSIDECSLKTEQNDY